MGRGLGMGAMMGVGALSDYMNGTSGPQSIANQFAGPSPDNPEVPRPEVPNQGVTAYPQIDLQALLQQLQNRNKPIGIAPRNDLQLPNAPSPISSSPPVHAIGMPRAQSFGMTAPGGPIEPTTPLQFDNQGENGAPPMTQKGKKRGTGKLPPGKTPIDLAMQDPAFASLFAPAGG